MNPMHHHLIRPIALAALAVGMAVQITAAEAPTPGSVAKTAEARRMTTRKSTYPFRGEVAAVEGKSIVLAKKSGTRPIEFAEDSLIERDGAPIRLADVKPGDYLRGMLQKTDSGGESLVRASAGGKYDKPAARATKATSKQAGAER
ncbi:MAG: hypothetical protein RIT19_1540 [Verrucomicrobiota bacterium]|jgi:hypothetical protein